MLSVTHLQSRFYIPVQYMDCLWYHFNFFIVPRFICTLIIFSIVDPKPRIFLIFFNLKLVDFQNPCFDSIVTCWIVFLPILIHSLSKYFLIRFANDVDIIFSVFCVINAGISDFPILIIITAVTGVFVG